MFCHAFRSHASLISIQSSVSVSVSFYIVLVIFLHSATSLFHSTLLSVLRRARITVSRILLFYIEFLVCYSATLIFHHILLSFLPQGVVSARGSSIFLVICFVILLHLLHVYSILNLASLFMFCYGQCWRWFLYFYCDFFYCPLLFLRWYSLVAFIGAMALTLIARPRCCFLACGGGGQGEISIANGGKRKCVALCCSCALNSARMTASGNDGNWCCDGIMVNDSEGN